MALLGRDTSVTGPVEGLLLETFQGTEALGTPYRFDLTLLSDDANIDVDDVLGQPITIQLKLDTGGFRYFSGIITYFAKTGLAMHHTRYAAVVNPTLSLFDYARDCRIFNDPTNFDPDPEVKKPTQDALKIVTEVLADRGFTNLESGSIKDHVYRDRRYCVQYRETDYNFIHRLLEDEGIYYFFQHSDGKHTMVLADAITAHAKVTGYESILYLPKQRKQAREEEHFWSLRVAGSLYPGRYSVLRGYDYTQLRPQRAQIEEQPSAAGQPGPGYEDYDYPGALCERERANEEAKVRAQTDRVANTLIEVEGNTMGLGVGDLVTLRRSLSDIGLNPFWREEDFDKEYLITSASYSISINQYETGDVADSDEPFKATFTLLDSQVPFRPQRRTVKPRIEGPQTAIVVGADGDEIYTDKMGRVKVQFDWDRLHDRDPKSSCWVRVAHVWAGKQWGAVHIPRVGQEVIVEFLDGDPDRPIITGRVYNADNKPPYDLPANKTQSGIKSRSSKEGTDKNFNEIRFEDLKGKEELHIQAERDMNTLVKRNQSDTVGANQTNTIGANRITTVKKDDTLAVEGSRGVAVTGMLSVSVDGKGGDAPGTIHSSHSVKGTYQLDATDVVNINGANKINIVCGGKSGSYINMTPDAIYIRSGKGAFIDMTEALVAWSAAGASISLTSSVQAAVMPDGGGMGASVQVSDKSATLNSPDFASKIQIENGKATLEADAISVEAAKGNSKMDLNSSGVTVTGSTVKING